MQYNKTTYAPFVRKDDSTSKVMTDVIIALLPCIFMSYLAFGFVPLMVILVAVGSALITEFIFSAIFFRQTDSVSDGSAIITGILLAFTIAPFTPLYVVAFGGAMAVLFGKLLWGGLGRNTFNPALIGREFMTVFFPAVMASRTIWYDKTAVNVSSIDIFGSDFFDQLFFKASGAIGEYSIFFLVAGGVFLLIRKRISWHIPFALLVAFSLLLFALVGFTEQTIQFSLGGLLLGTIFMATDMPSSASSNYGKIYYGAMIGIVAVICILNDVKYEYMSYSILLLNAFVHPIDWVFRPKVWGQKLDIMTRLWQVLSVTAAILIACFAVIYLHHMGFVMYLVFTYIAFCIVRFIAKEAR
ncbi:electron transport complex protein RnfD [Dysgonomonas sp. PFB1-18]|uniref:RnfABCDGE type electron transport complex subunit D n=1 Tax=unclassified Dysgonomonas TaxID=2630389 RepID=UPI0024741ADC|nr:MULTISPECIES: RnfABCDGE type electron transport complex subunit D [unclassified Dysgonomonas]MDH6308374.1 electron transport complex protein RnfD [Dysgonomonas sp. PF1-14]MDH6338189.1 electron transport complex protein RnfD [Dysgonomonas sp. PF1-16]MDH6379686.1 electron transport complex protein RnfD [Dysgonomonas sp. PFB1-18]MDH6397225.1 electron transport complex protein RnfD [Dysgonomonas sp. PF1-23]